MKTLILVVDDDAQIRRAVPRALRGLRIGDTPCRFAEAENAEAALVILAREEAACVICDMNMGPGLLGIQLLEHLRESGNMVPFILHSSLQNGQEYVAGRLETFGGHLLEKPVVQWLPVVEMISSLINP